MTFNICLLLLLYLSIRSTIFTFCFIVLSIFLIANMAHYNPNSKNPPWVRNNVQQQPLLTQQMTVQPVALSQALTATHLAQNQLSQVQITPAIQGQVQLPLTQAHLSLNQPLTSTFGQVQINQAQLANITTLQQQQAPTQTYFTPSISLQQNVGIPQGTIQIQPSGVVIPTSISTSIAPPGIAMPTTLATMPVTTSGTYNLNRLGGVPPPNLPAQPAVKQRVFSGIVSKLHDNFGFIDEDVFFQNSCVKGTIPQVGDRVLVEASYNANMPFKWNATRVQVIAPPPQHSQKMPMTVSSGSNTDLGKHVSREWPNRDRTANDYRDSGRSTPKSRDSRPRDRRSRSRKLSRSRSPSRKRSRSPPPSPRRRARPIPRYSVQIPKVSLDCGEANVVELRRRYNHMYIPSDCLGSVFWWVKSFPVNRPFPLDKPVAFHIFDKDVDPPEENTAVYQAPDADYAYSAKVMLPSLPPLEEIYKKCCPDDDKEEFVHPARLVRFLVGMRGKNEPMAIGGPWSPSLDGSDPQGDPQVLIRTAIRTCKALTAIDLSGCTQWYRVAEIRYHRVSSMKSRTETVLLFVPDVWSCIPTASQWETIVQSYSQTAAEIETEMETKTDETTVEGSENGECKKEATHFSKLEPKNMKIGDLRAELEARNLNSKGFRTQLIPRLTIALKSEAEEEKRKQEVQIDTEEESNEQTTEDVQENHKLDFASCPQILVHPSRTARGGKFNCQLVSLSVLLDYRPEDTKEHTFEVSLFSELFNEMLMRDFGIIVYRSIVNESTRKEKKENKEKREEDNDKNSKREKPTVPNTALLLAFSYFDLSHCNYIASKDLEDLFLTLGLDISRAQVRKLLQKVVTDDTLRYKKLAEKHQKYTKEEEEKDESSAIMTIDTQVVKMDPVKEENVANGSVGEESSLILFRGSYVNIGQLLLRLQQSESSRNATEYKLKLVQAQSAEYAANLAKSSETIDTLYRQLEKEKQELESAREELCRTQTEANRFLEALSRIQSITYPIVEPSFTTEANHEESEKMHTNAELNDKVDH